MHITKNKNFLSYNNYKAKCAIGKRGIGYKRREGDLITPKGLYKIKYVLFRSDRVKIKTKIKKKIIKKNNVWCDDPASKYYNKLVELPFNYRHEKLYKKENIYDIILVLDFNMNPVKKNKGSAIFIHIAKNNFKKTEGCIAIKKKALLKILNEIKVSTKVKIESQK